MHKYKLEVEDSEYTVSSGEKELYAGILRRAWLDCHNYPNARKEEDYTDPVMFLKSNSARYLCEILGLDTDILSEMIRTPPANQYREYKLSKDRKPKNKKHDTK